MIPEKYEHDLLLTACNYHLTTAAERNILGYVASMAAAHEHVAPGILREARALAGITNSLEGSVYDRPSTP